MGRPSNGYYVKGKRIPSVTTIIGRFKDSGALIYWSWNTAYEQLQQAVHLLDESWQHDELEGDQRKRLKDDVRDFMKTQPLERGNYRTELKAAATAGTVAHELIEIWIKSKNPHAPKTPTLQYLMINYSLSREDAERALNSYQAFLNWVKQTKLKVQKTEVSLTSNQYGFGGTLDGLGTIHSGRSIFDWKTSKGLYPDYLLQLAAYGILWEENNPNKKITGGYHLVRIDKATGDFHHHHWQELEKEKEQFLRLLECYQVDKEIKKRAK